MKKQLLLLLTIAFSIQSYATIIYVNPTATGNDDGTSWADAYTDLQMAFDNLTPGANDSVFVAEGTYKPSGTDASDALRIDEKCSVFGGFPASGNPDFNDRDWNTFLTIFDGDLNGNDILHDLTQNKADNAPRVLAVFATGERVVIDGVIVKNSGNSTTGFSAIASSSFLHMYNSRIEDNRNPGAPNGVIRLSHQGTGDSCYFNNTHFFYNFSDGTAVIIRQEAKVLVMENCTVSHTFGGEAAIRSEGDTFKAVNCVFSHVFDENGNLPNLGLYFISSVLQAELDIIHCTFNKMNDAIYVENSSIETTDVFIKNSYFDVVNAQEGTPVFGNHNGTLNVYSDSVATNADNYIANNQSNNLNETGSAFFGSFIYEVYDTAAVTYKLDCSSEFVDRGIPLANITEDIEGNNRVIGNGPDLGAYESNCLDAGLDEMTSQDRYIQIYPNPVTDILNIESSSPISQVSILSVTGREMMKSRVQPEVINTSKLPSGVYFVKIYSKGQVSTRKLIKK